MKTSWPMHEKNESLCSRSFADSVLRRCIAASTGSFGSIIEIPTVKVYTSKSFRFCKDEQQLGTCPHA